MFVFEIAFIIMKKYLLIICFTLFNSCSTFKIDQINLIEIEKERTLKKADAFLTENPITVTSFISNKSAGGIHDFFSESDYWWPDPDDSSKPYIRKDGLTNPNNFIQHRQAMIRFSIHVSTLTSAYLITNNKKYAQKSIEHLKAWFIDPATKMNPHLQYAQAIKGITVGRGIGIIDAIHLVEVAQSVYLLKKYNMINNADFVQIKNWFEEFLKWMTTSKNGIEEREAQNNHGTCWVMQVAAYSKLVEDEELINYCIERFKKILLPNQMEKDGSFPLELKRTKPYSYSLFNLDAMVTICQILRDKENLFYFTTSDGKNIKQAIDFMFPFIEDKSRWKYPADVMYYEYFPNRQPSLLFGALAFYEEKYFELWKKLNPDPTNEEVIRNFPIRNPILWIN